MVPSLDLISAGGCPLEANLPDFACEDFSKEGCFFEEVEEDFSRFSNLARLLNEILEVEVYTEAELADIHGREQMAEIVTMDTTSGVALYWGRIDGLWSILFIDAAAYDCSA